MRVVIIGNGVSGITVAKLLRAQHPRAEIVVLSEENDHYYPRPVLIEFLAGRLQRQELYFYPESWYEERKLQIYLGKHVSEIELKEKKVKTMQGEEFPYTFLVIATGAKSLIPPIPGCEKPGVFSLRTRHDADSLKEFISRKNDESGQGKEAVVIGGGYLGLETAYALLGAGLVPTVLETSEYILKKHIDEQGAKILQAKLEGLGVRFKTDAHIEKIYGNEHAEGVMLKNGEKLAASVVVIAAGITPDINISRRAGLKTERGLVVDKYMQTSDESVFGCGDVTEFEGKMGGVIPVCLAQAQVAAYNILNGPKLVYRGTLMNTSLKIAGTDLTCLGMTQPPREAFQTLKSTDENRGIYKKVIVSANKVIGVILLGDRKDVLVWNKIITQGVDIGRYKETLLKDNFDLSKILSNK